MRAQTVNFLIMLRPAIKLGSWHRANTIDQLFHANIHKSFFSMQFDLTVIFCREKGVDADISYQSLSIEIKA